GALGGGAIGVGMTMADMALQAAGGGTGGGKTQSQIDYEYDQVYSQFTEQDYQDLADGKAEAKAKWEDIQTQLDALNNSFANSNKVSASGMAGSASSDAITAANEAFAKYGSAASNQRYMGVMDYSKSSSEPRFMIIDRETGKITYTQAAHGKGSDPNNTGYATNFSDVKGQNTSELGAFVATPYYSGSMGKNALSLDGLEDSNKNAGNTSNGKAIHTSDYVQNNGQQCGRSLGCIAVPNSMGDTALTKLSNAFIYSYYPQK
ncbi:MAG: murein L,D-transpeptidase catalytic domain-containing protein, partial [bacterium]